MTKEEVEFISGMNMCDEISNEAYKKIMCHCEEQKHIFDRDCEHCSKTYGTLGCCDTVSNKWVYSCKEGQREYLLNKIRAEIEEYGSICVAYAITDKTKTDEGIEKLVSDVLSDAKRQVLDIIDKHKAGEGVSHENN